MFFDSLRVPRESAKKGQNRGRYAQIYNLLYKKELDESQKFKCPKSPPCLEKKEGGMRKHPRKAPCNAGKNGVEFET